MASLTQKTLLGISGTRGKLQFTLRMAPLIDIIFLLLIFFFISATFRPEENFLPIKLSRSQASMPILARAEPLGIYIFATEKGCSVEIAKLQSVAINDISINEDLALVIQKINLTLQSQKRNSSDPIEIRCGDDVKWEHLAKIYNPLHCMGITDITFKMTR